MERKLWVILAAVLVLPLAAPAVAVADDDDDDDRRRYRRYFSCLAEKVVRADGDIVDVAVSNPNFSTLVTAVSAAGLVDTLKGPGPFTVFAPTNAAFEGLPGFLLAGALSDVDVLTAILTYHVVPGIVDPRFAFRPREVGTVQGQTLFLTADRRSADVNQSNVNCQGIRTSNGIIWVIDSVLLPQFPPAQ